MWILLKLLFQARLVTITTFSFVSTNTGAVISRSDGLHVSFRVVFFFFLIALANVPACVAQFATIARSKRSV